MGSKGSQGGWSVRGLLTGVALLGAAGWAAVRIVPLYYQYWTVQTILDTHVRQAEAYDTPSDLRRAMRASLAGQGAGEAVPPAAVTVTGLDAGYRVVADYERTLPLTERVRLVYHFRAEAESGG